VIWFAAMSTLVTGAFGCIGSHVEEPIPFPDALDDARYQRDLGPALATPLEAGVRRTLEEFARLEKEGRLDARELG